MRATKAKAEKKTDKRTAAQIKAGVRAVVQSFLASARATNDLVARGPAGRRSPDSLWDRIFHWQEIKFQIGAGTEDMALSLLSAALSKRGLI